MKNIEHTADCSSEEKQSYQKPQLITFGHAAELTRGTVTVPVPDVPTQGSA